ncbi:mycothiol transferase [Nocardiopsis suaedae]|uniref:DUF664 domain-containing protein n=1 Tax=Nocardiopsis suaedae TaxID=3018444 RepID=A0ABT4TRA4_9ACTN|nr:DUF664 domain-containing protein [Nocardiopsis suaedae]MDA2807213.1 DUF664 domain-containing protein [Nocardiopsis suaedae]
MLSAFLDRHRASVRRACAGLSPAASAAAPVPGSPHLTVRGVVSHLTWSEHHWFEAVLLGRPERVADPPEGAPAAGPGAVRRPAPGSGLADLIAGYEAQCERSRTVTARLEPRSGARRSRVGEPPVTLRWVLIHMVEETAAHVGQLEMLRGLVEADPLRRLP